MIVIGAGLIHPEWLSTMGLRIRIPHYEPLRQESMAETLYPNECTWFFTCVSHFSEALKSYLCGAVARRLDWDALQPIFSRGGCTFYA